MKYYQHRDYLKMIINGLLYHRDYLSNYLKREQKKSENDFIEFSEFIGRTITVVRDLEDELRRFRDQRENELEAKKDGANDPSIEEQIKSLSITKDIFLPLEIYTEGEFQGSIGFWDINKIRVAINEAFDFYSFEKEDDNNEPIDYFLENRKEKDAVEQDVSDTAKELYPHPEVFKSLKAFLIFQQLYESKKNSKNLLADFSFIYRRMYKDDLIQDYQKPEVFRQWLSKEPFEIVLDNPFKTLNNCSTKHKEDDYHKAKLLVQMQTS